MRAVQEFVGRAHVAEERLRAFMVAQGMQPRNRTLAHSWHGIVDQIGTMPAGGGYLFHGNGCTISLPGELPIDVDWTPYGTIVLDPYKMRPWIEGRCSAVVEVEAIKTAIGALRL